jgi:lipopolysaccharide transport system permease protein
MRRHTLATGIGNLPRHRSLLVSLVRRDIETRFRGTMLGALWTVLQPLLMLSVYAFVFGGIFGTRWNQQGDLSEFVLMLYCGLIVHGLFSDTLSRAPSAVLSTPGYVKKVVFPLELLPLAQLASAVFTAVISVLLLCAWMLVQRHSLPVTALLAPLVLAPLLLLTSGLAWFLAALGVFLRDVSQIIQVAMSVLLFLSPVFYPASATPVAVRPWLHLNPLTWPMESLRAVLISGTWPDWRLGLVYGAISCAVALTGLWFFQRARPAFADVI